ncbi:chaperone protein dnaj [Phtheirospermum japonicum]|uniref:Chaperone protein dnaj n=1 Tax=Phtheirospermum japonicum TaxID=374723 RepID=A0A830BL29_9LAMI|nr:chaperone protein dnaj [Phtheirospermum japonicum]
MGSNIDEALRAKAFAEKHFIERDFIGAKNYAFKAQALFPELEGISQMVATFGVHLASEAKINGELDFYSILGLDPSVEKPKLKKQYKKLAVLLHPDKNRTVGADGAFRLVSEAWALLSDSVKRTSYDQRRSMLSHSRPDSFWTVCTSCHVQYEYLRKYVNKKLSCKNCRSVFVAVETGLAPMNGSFPYTTCGVTCIHPAQNGPVGHHNISFQGSSNNNHNHNNNVSVNSSFVFYQANGETNKPNLNGEHNRPIKATNGHANGNNSYVAKPKRGRPSKKIKTDFGSPFTNGHGQIEAKNKIVANGNGPSKPETSTRRFSAIPAVDARQLLISKARSVIWAKLEETRVESEEAEKRKKSSEKKRLARPGPQLELKRNASMSITVPDPDFHDFDRDRSEECFKPKQIWALYDEEDGMPRLYCLIREVISVSPFKIFISYLSSKSDCEFGLVNWLGSGFTKSCGGFRVFHSETVDQVNIFSHLLSREKAGRGGLVRIYPRGGDIWAVYRNWAPDWDVTTPAEVRHQYEMVEVIDDYSEENGVWVTPLVKLDGYKTVYQRNGNTNAIRWVPRREMLRFSHQVPACSLVKVEGVDLPEGCWDLDPAATPDELLQGETKEESGKKAGESEIFASN